MSLSDTGGGLLPLATSYPFRRSRGTGPTEMMLNSAFKTSYRDVVNMRFAKAAALRRLV